MKFGIALLIASPIVVLGIAAKLIWLFFLVGVAYGGALADWINED